MRKLYLDLRKYEMLCISLYHCTVKCCPKFKDNNKWLFWWRRKSYFHTLPPLHSPNDSSVYGNWLWPLRSEVQKMVSILLNHHCFVVVVLLMPSWRHTKKLSTKKPKASWIEHPFFTICLFQKNGFQWSLQHMARGFLNLCTLLFKNWVLEFCSSSLIQMAIKFSAPIAFN